MTFYRDRVVPRLVNWACGSRGMERWRARACEGLSGVVVEIGFGSGLNVPHYPDAIELVYAVEPSVLANRLAAKRIAGARIPIHHVGLDGQALPLPDGSCDAALITFTLCTVDDAPLVLKEMMRVLKPGGQLHFLEHGRAPDLATARWQTRLDPLERRMAGGCRLTRDPLALIVSAGFRLVWSDQRYARGPKPWSFFTVGVATTPPE